MTRRLPLKERMDAAVDKSGGSDACWAWTKGRNFRRGGYGKIKIRGKDRGAHRVAWELENGPIPEGMLVCHRCDNPPCCNPSHLFLGSHADNNHDRDAKGRHVARDCSGANNGRARLARADVDVIRTAYREDRTSQAVLAAEFNVSRRAIYAIVNDRTWAS